MCWSLCRNDPQVTESLDERLDALRDLIVTLYPQEQQATIIEGLKSGKLRNLIFALDHARYVGVAITVLSQTSNFLTA
jgi:hypothetical protein